MCVCVCVCVCQKDAFDDSMLVRRGERATRFFEKEEQEQVEEQEEVYPHLRHVDSRQILQAIPFSFSPFFPFIFLEIFLFLFLLLPKIRQKYSSGFMRVFFVLASLSACARLYFRLILTGFVLPRFCCF